MNTIFYVSAFLLPFLGGVFATIASIIIWFYLSAFVIALIGVHFLVSAVKSPTGDRIRAEIHKKIHYSDKRSSPMRYLHNFMTFSAGIWLMLSGHIILGVAVVCIYGMCLTSINGKRKQLLDIQKTNP